MTGSDQLWRPFSGQDPKQSVPELRANTHPEPGVSGLGDQGPGQTQKKLVTKG